MPSMLAFCSVMSVLVRFVVRTFSTNSRPASGRPPAALGRQRPTSRASGLRQRDYLPEKHKSGIVTRGFEGL
jgi:hypothetical protein